MAGELEVELTPQGTLAERLRAGGAGIPAFYTPCAAGTIVQEGGTPVKYRADGSVEIESEPRELRNFDGRDYVLERAIKGDFSLVKAWKADTRGNLVFKGTARNFNVDAATAGKVCIAEVEEIVGVGESESLGIEQPVAVRAHERGSASHPPLRSLAGRGAPARHLRAPPDPRQGLREAHREADDFRGHRRRREHCRRRAPASCIARRAALSLACSLCAGKLSPERLRIVKRAALEFKDGDYVNLGIGIPTLSSNFVGEGARSAEIHRDPSSPLCGRAAREASHSWRPVCRHPHRAPIRERLARHRPVPSEGRGGP